MRVAAAVTTFNRLWSLQRCIELLRAQTRAVDEIIVVDDASGDGTGEWLAEQSDLVVVRQPENYGCATSFQTAERLAYERGHDWVLVMDDDVYLTPETLEKLLEAAAALQAEGVRIGGLKTFETSWSKGGQSLVPFSFPSTAGRAWRYLYNSREVRAEMGRGAPVEIDWYSFCGALISREALASGGFSDPEYFYWCDDIDVACRQRALGFRHYLVPRAVVEHLGSEPRRKSGRPPKAGWRHYYIHRNRWRFMRTHGRLLGQPKSLVCRASMVAGTLRHAAGAARRGDFRGTRLVLRGFVDGVLGRMGKRVAPGG